MKKILYPTLFLLVVACKNDPAPNHADTVTSLTPALPPLPNTPETVIKMWEEKYATNQFEAIMPISADAVLGVVTSLAQTQKIEALAADADVQHIVRIECQTQTDSTAVCDCILADKYSKVRSQHQLIKVAGQWMTRKNDITPYKETVAEKAAAKTEKAEKIEKIEKIEKKEKQVKK